MGTIDSSAFALGTLLAKTRHVPSEQSKKQVRLFTLLGMIAAAGASLFLFSFLSSFFALISLVSVVGAALILSLIFELKSSEINIFLVTGTLTFILGLIFKFITDNPLSDF
jgi:hypothetical protein